MMDEKTRDDLLKLFQGETCTRCGVCTEACHVHASMGQVKYIAAYRGEIVRRLYKKYFKGRGKAWPSVGEAKELSDMALDELYDAAYSCTGCRRSAGAAWCIARLGLTPRC
jgi:Fe-S oxidoreductase